MLWKKDPGMKYTDMCIYIDENMSKLAVLGEYPDVEDKIYNYLWLLVKALAIKKCMFTNFQDYDPFAFHAANRLFFALHKNQLNEGKIIKGKLIKPIKSCLNYTKALLYPMKVEYQQESFREIFSEEFVSKKFDAFSYREQLKNDARDSQGTTKIFWEYVQEELYGSGHILNSVLEKSPFNKRSIEYKKVRLSIILNCIYILKTKNKLDPDIQTVILWKLPKSMSNYIKILLREFFTALKLSIMECANAVSIDDRMLEAIITEGDSDYEK